ncbi:MAG: alpha/beta hydrolase, partial [Spirochaetales bacterium]|nr:alpha/beta hydrolase [Spirochaetales bacterium]
WKNQADISSYALFAALDIKNVISSLSKPVLFIAGTKAMTADLTQTAYDNAQDDKELYWIDGATHVSLYHNEEQISQASKKLDEFFEQKLKPQVFKNIGLDVAKYIAGFFI